MIGYQKVRLARRMGSKTGKLKKKHIYRWKVILAENEKAQSMTSGLAPDVAGLV